VVCAAIAAGCGEAAPDLFLITRTGDIPGAHLTLEVADDGTVHCNHGAGRMLTSAEIITARQLQRDLKKPADRRLSLAPGPQPVLRYRVELEAGTVRFSDDSPRQPRPFFQVAAFTRDVAQHVCGLAR
jgi:hypothetical protein